MAEGLRLMMGHDDARGDGVGGEDRIGAGDMRHKSKLCFDVL